MRENLTQTKACLTGEIKLRVLAYLKRLSCVYPQCSIHMSSTTIKRRLAPVLPNALEMICSRSDIVYSPEASTGAAGGRARSTNELDRGGGQEERL